jgi:hypothetical protein
VPLGLNVEKDDDAKVAQLMPRRVRRFIGPVAIDDSRTRTRPLSLKEKTAGRIQGRRR